ncbi:hypothetical protein RF11_01496 [Thelohanellus kitauei]|uniref:Uncharacterized protein n=1 Tax=Thelohanellus kitauei TaxID=669202 RepID=A0A0C2IA51_THEKT|nr:hypothetical protein RF11_01496 [Thelohanellus kitauei]
MSISETSEDLDDFLKRCDTKEGQEDDKLKPIPEDLIRFCGYTFEDQPGSDIEENQLNSNVPSIKLPEQAKLILAGKVVKRVGDLYVVDPTETLLDSCTVLFHEDGRMFGLIIDIFGPVKLPQYIVQHNTLPFEMPINVYYTDYYAGNTTILDVPSIIKAQFDETHDDSDEGVVHEDHSENDFRRNSNKQRRSRKKKGIAQTQNTSQNNSAVFYQPPWSVNNPTYMQTSGNYYDYDDRYLPHNQPPKKNIRDPRNFQS